MHKPIGAIAAGHPDTAAAAELILREGGNAFDAVVAAQLTAFVAEPVLTSPGGGGFLLAEKEDGMQTVYDFFVQTPLQKQPVSRVQFAPITADFGEARQEFHIGAGSVAAPGMVKGLFAIQRDLGTMPMTKLAEYAIALAKKGMTVNAFQSQIFDIIEPIYRSTDETLRIFGSRREPGRLIREGEILKLPELASFLEELAADGEELFYRGEIARTVVELCSELGGHLTEEDFHSYRVVKRNPLLLGFRKSRVSINPPPSSGGVLIAFALKLMEEMNSGDLQFGSVQHLALLASIQDMTHKAKLDAFVNSPYDNPAERLLDPGMLVDYKREIAGRMASFRGTTQISVADRHGNLASLTSSNGEGSGVMIPGTGVMLNNMLGEEDLNPGGFHNWQAGQRMTSMMAPAILKLPDGTRAALGSGGSNRIRSAMMQVLMNLAEFGLDPEVAVSSPRIHCEEGLLNIEAGFENRVVEKLARHYPDHKTWKEKNLFFGGVHVVSHGPNGYAGAGDERRGGVAGIV